MPWSLVSKREERAEIRNRGQRVWLLRAQPVSPSFRPRAPKELRRGNQIVYSFGLTSRQGLYSSSLSTSTSANPTQPNTPTLKTKLPPTTPPKPHCPNPHPPASTPKMKITR